jgi:hypothetical protein
MSQFLLWQVFQQHRNPQARRLQQQLVMSKCAPKALSNQGLTIVDINIFDIAIGAKLTNINICIVLCII